jgi:hypothetical protein
LARRTDTALRSELAAIEMRQLALARNPVLELFLRSAKAFPCLDLLGDPPVPQHALRDFLDSRRAVSAALTQGDPVAAALAQERSFDRPKRSLARVPNSRLMTPMFGAS